VARCEKVQPQNVAKLCGCSFTQRKLKWNFNGLQRKQGPKISIIIDMINSNPRVKGYTVLLHGWGGWNTKETLSAFGQFLKARKLYLNKQKNV